MITQKMAGQIFGRTPTDKQIVDLNDCLIKFHINTAPRVRHFLSQCAHESAGLKYTKEIASGRAYNGRKDLGNIHPGDGPRFKGAGVIQLTGRYNYTAFSNFMKDPDIMAGVEYVAAKYPFMSAGFWWYMNKMNARCDAGATVKEITRKVNGGYNGLNDRIKYYNRCVQVIPNDWVLNVPPPKPQQIPQFDPNILEVSEPVSIPATAQPANQQNTIQVDDTPAPVPAPTANAGGLPSLDALAGGDAIGQLAKVSPSSLWTTIVSKFGAWGVLAAGLWEENQTIIIVGAVIIIAVLVYLHFSKKRASERAIAFGAQ